MAENETGQLASEEFEDPEAAKGSEVGPHLDSNRQCVAASSATTAPTKVKAAKSHNPSTTAAGSSGASATIDLTTPPVTPSKTTRPEEEERWSKGVSPSAHDGVGKSSSKPPELLQYDQLGEGDDTTGEGGAVSLLGETPNDDVMQSPVPVALDSAEPMDYEASDSPGDMGVSISNYVKSPPNNTEVESTDKARPVGQVTQNASDPLTAAPVPDRHLNAMFVGVASLPVDQARPIGNASPLLTANGLERHSSQEEEARDKERLNRRNFSDEATSDEEGGSGGGGEENSASYRVRQVAKVKQFFTTLQTFGNKQGSESAEQVQELITALVNDTATIEEFHQEIQTIINFPLKEFIIPFLRENLDLFRAELKESSQALSEIIGADVASSSSATLTPHLHEDELPVPVLPSSTPSGHTRHTLHSTPSTSAPAHVIAVTTSTGPKRLPQPHYSVASNPQPSHPHTSQPLARSSHTHTSRVHTAATSHHHPTLLSSSSSVALGSGGVMMVVADQSDGDHAPQSATPPPAPVGHNYRRIRRSPERILVRERDNVYFAPPPKKPCPPPTDHAHLGAGESHPSPSASLPSRVHHQRHKATYYPPPPPTHPHPSPSHPHPSPSHPHPSPVSTVPGLEASTPTTYVSPSPSLGPDVSSHATLVTDDCSHIDTMLTSILGMVEKTRSAVKMLRDRILPVLERREGIDSVLQHRVTEAVDRVRRQNAEEKQTLLLEASKQMHESIAAAKSELEEKMARTQTTAVQEALRDANLQSTSKESCWNCGRRATETCSGCNKARYCGTFCQHKDWSNHMHQCASGLQGQAETENYREDSPAHGSNLVPVAIVKQEPPPDSPVVPPGHVVVAPSAHAGSGVVIVNSHVTPRVVASASNMDVGYSVRNPGS